MSNFYSDTDLRMNEDAEFRQCVTLLMQLADRNGYTPGELKQIAFRAALELELRRPGCQVLTKQQLEELDEAARRRVTPDEIARIIALVNAGVLK
jgi:hypothetical protein